MRFSDEVLAVGIQLRVLRAEVVMDGCTLEDALFHPFAFAHFVVIHLQDNAHTLHEEDAAKDGQQQFFMNDYRANANDAADGQRACIAHEHLCGVGVVPQKTDEGTHEGAHEHHQLLRPRYVHDVEV